MAEHMQYLAYKLAEQPAAAFVQTSLPFLIVALLSLKTRILGFKDNSRMIGTVAILSLSLLGQSAAQGSYGGSSMNNASSNLPIVDLGYELHQAAFYSKCNRDTDRGNTNHLHRLYWRLL